MDMLAPMRLYTLTRRHFVLVFGVFLICFVLTVFVGVAGPKVIAENSYNVLSTGVNGSKTGPFQIKSPPLSNYNQQLWLMCVIQITQNNEEDFRKNIEMNVELKGVLQDASIMNISDNVHRKSRFLHCAQPHQLCDEIIVAHLGYLNYTRYQINVSLKGLEGMSQNIQNVTFVIKTYNPKFSQMEIWFRFVFVVLTFIVTCVFAHSLRKFSMRDWGIEQKWMSILLPLLLLYNDPFFPLSFLTNSWIPGTLDTFFQALFLCALLLFWLCVYHGIRVQGERKFATFYLPKLVIVGMLWISAVILGIWQLLNELQDPTYRYNMDMQHFQGLKVFFLLVAVLYGLYLVFLLVRAWSELKNMPYADSQMKDNPAFSMLNDSDDEVIYGSDYEVMPLQNGRAIKTTSKYQDESDSD
ncbi:transmembrane protein 181 isoform X3 [Astyanax mexicanus]|uniref:transmembrane protein 181 isoform X3 n=1 Tax=Astyanax mexicanus TaxID=7994 RepID=UPI0020CB18C9|nr:transmembrane protein 181 isoform X3 [Astyanax mexicanus]